MDFLQNSINDGSPNRSKIHTIPTLVRKGIILGSPLAHFGASKWHTFHSIVILPVPRLDWNRLWLHFDSFLITLGTLLDPFSRFRRTLAMLHFETFEELGVGKCIISITTIPRMKLTLHIPFCGWHGADLLCNLDKSLYAYAHAADPENSLRHLRSAS